VAGLPSHLGGIEDDLRSTNQALGETTESVQEVGTTLAVVSQDLHATSEALQEYDELFAETMGQLRKARRSIRDQVRTGRFVLTGILLWLAFSQIAPLMLGYTWLLQADGFSGNEALLEREGTRTDAAEAEE
jgi:hypothetical protein